jgi:ribosomal protein S18 acetylase RimI-like enzyme
MQAAESWAREQGYEEMFLAVRIDNDRAIRLYEGLGWIRVLDGNDWRGRMRKSLTVEERTRVNEAVSF